MSQPEFDQLLSSLDALSPDQLNAIRRELDGRISLPGAVRRNEPAEPAGESVFDVLDRSGLIGCLEGAPDSPTDLSTNPKHMEGFGCG